MAKESMKAREAKREALVAKYAAKRQALKEAGDFEALQKAFEQTLERGKSSGEFAPTLDVPFVAYILLNMNHSLNIMSAYQQDQALAYRLVDHTLQQLLQ